MNTTIRYTTLTVAGLLVGAFSPLPAQVAVGTAARVGTSVATAMPVATGQVQGAAGTAVSATTGAATSAGSVSGSAAVRGAAGAGAGTGGHPVVTSLVLVRQSVDAATHELLANITLTAQQQSRIDAYAQGYAKEIQTGADAEANTSTSVSSDAAQRAQSHARVVRARAAAYRDRVRSALTAEQQATFDANVQAGTTAEVDAPSGASASAGASVNGSAGASTGSHAGSSTNPR
mgnify:CR=1 FL=1